MARKTTASTSRKRRLLRGLLAAVTTAATIPMTLGCHVWDRIGPGPHDTTVSYHENSVLSIEYPEVAECATPVTIAAEAAQEPFSLEDPSKLPTLDLTLDQAIAMAMQNSPVIRTLPTNQVLSAANATTIYDPALTASSAQGVEAALSAFDAQYSNTLNWVRTDRPTNRDFGGGIGAAFPGVENYYSARYGSELRKRTAYGSSFSLRHVVNYRRNTQQQVIDNSVFESAFDGWVEAEWRQPVLRGYGLQYNRIVGSSQTPGTYNGVLIARINEDVTLTQFEESIVNLVWDVERAYWNLFTAYRLLEANIKGRESALRTYQYQKARLDVGAGRQDEEAQAQSQYYQFEANVQRQLGGPNGLYASEQALRYLLGMPASDGKLIKPVTEPIDSEVSFDWNSVLSQALDRRVEIRRQRFQVKRRELELYAARLNKRPQLDFVGKYRFQGFGDHLVGDDDSFYRFMADERYREWEAGVEFTLPVGLRQASVALANARLQLNRERALLAEAELRISHDLSDAARDVALTYELVETNYNRYQADLRQVDVLVRRYLEGNDNINFLLQAQRSLVQSEVAFYQSLADYNLAIMLLHREKGSLLAYNQIQLAESAWAPGARMDAYEKGQFLTPRLDPSKVITTPPVTRRSFNPSEVQSSGGVAAPAPQVDMVPVEVTEPADPDNSEPIFAPADQPADRFSWLDAEADSPSDRQ